MRCARESAVRQPVQPAPPQRNNMPVGAFTRTATAMVGVHHGIVNGSQLLYLK